jgi:hypothetical protein
MGEIYVVGKKPKTCIMKTTKENQRMSEKDINRQLPVANMQDIATAGELVAKSGMLGACNPADGFIIVSICLQQGISFLKFGEMYNVIGGRIAMRSEAMLAKLLELGGEYEVLARTPDEASLKLKFKTASFISTLTWAEAQNERYTKQKDGKTLKENWSTPRRRSQMLWARAVSDGVRVVCPLATQGTYTPEEVMDFDDAINVTATTTAEKTEAPKALALPNMAVTPAQSPNFSTPQQPPASQPAVPPAPPINSNPAPGETPFDTPPAKPSVDYSICRAPGMYQGKPWCEVPVDQLKLALNIVSPSITAGDHMAINEILTQKGQA